MEERLSQKELSRRLSKAAAQVAVGADYLHYKNHRYTVIKLAILEATNEICVIYQAQYGERLTFIRPVANWIEDVEWEGKQQKRFKKL